MERSALSPREQQVVHEVVAGKTDQEIAAVLALSVPTVKHYLTNVLNKWQCENRTQVAVRALREAQARKPRRPI